MKLKKTILPCVALSMLLTGCDMLNEETEEVVNTTDVILRTVDTDRISTMSMADTMIYSGRVAPSKEVTVVPSMSGKIIECNFDIGDFVNKDDRLIVIDDSDLVDNMRNLEASYALSEINFRNTEKTYNNNIILFDEGVIAKADIDQIIYSYDTAKANLYSLEVQMDILQSNMKDTVLYAPSEGVITAKSVEVGGYASMGSPAYTLVTLDPIRVNVGISEHLINDISLDETFPISISAVSDSQFSGTVAMINPLMDSTGLYTVGIDIDNPDGLIKSGMLADVTFTLQAAGNAVVVPANAVVTKDDGNYIYLINRNEDGTATAKETKVTTGMSNGEMIQITSGASAGREMVTKGQTYISDGEQVQISTEYVREEVAPESEETENSENSEEIENSEITEEPKEKITEKITKTITEKFAGETIENPEDTETEESTEDTETIEATEATETIETTEDETQKEE